MNKMRPNALIKTGGTIMAIGGHSNAKNNRSIQMSTIMNNRSITTTESSGIDHSKLNTFNKNINKQRKFNYKIKTFHNSLNYVPLNTIGTGKSTWYHTKTVSSMNKEKKELLQDADLIMKNRIKMNLGVTRGLQDRKKGRTLEKAKELCLNNYMITQLKDKRNEINKKEFYIDMALKNSEKQYELDYRAFIDFVEEIKKKDNKEEEILNRIKSRKDSTEARLKEEKNVCKKLEEKVENIIKIIVMLKNFGSFIHKVFNTPFIYDELSNYKLIGKRYISLKDKLIEIYEKNNSKINEEEINDILDNGERLIQQYNEYEKKLVKTLDEKNILEKEIITLINKDKLELISLRMKLKDCEKEYERIKLEKKRIVVSMKEYQTSNKSEIKEYSNYIIELGNEIGIESHKNNHNRTNTMTEYLYYCKDTINALEKKEMDIIEYIKEIENIINYGDEQDKQIIEKLLLDRKRLIKKEKQLMLKKQQDEYESKKKLRAIERAKRIVIKGRKVFEEVETWRNKKNDIQKVDDDDDDDNQYLYYSDDN